MNRDLIDLESLAQLQRASAELRERAATLRSRMRYADADALERRADHVFDSSLDKGVEP